MAVRWRSDGGQMAVRWRSDGGQMAVRWRSDGSQMAVRWRSDGSRGLHSPAEAKCGQVALVEREEIQAAVQAVLVDEGMEATLVEARVAVE